MTGRLEACIRLAEKVGLRGKKILDIGCSDGWFLKEAFEMGARDVCAIEPDDGKIKTAKKIAPKAKIKKRVAGKLDFPKNSFDVVTLFDVVEHVPKNTEPQVFSEINRVLRPKGYLLLSTPFKFWLANITDPAWYFGHRHYSRDKLDKLLGDAGFKIKEFKTSGGMWEAVAIWVLYTSKWIFHIPMPFEEWFDTKRRKEFRKKGKAEIFLIAQKLR